MPIPFTPLSSTGTTCADLIERTRWHLNTGLYEPINRLALDIDDTLTALQFDYELGGIRDGAIISVDLELMYVWEVINESTRTVMVQRGIAGSTAAAHDSSALVTVNPRFSDFHILKALNDDLRSLSGLGLYATRALTFTFDPPARTYDLFSDVIDVLEVRYRTQSDTDRWPLIDNYAVLRDMPSVDFPSGIALRLDGRVESQQDVLVRYKAPFTALTALADVVELATGLLAEALDIPPLGAAAMLSVARDTRRTDTFAQGDTRRAAEVPSGSPRAAAAPLLSARSLRVGEEQGRLAQRYPLRRRRGGQR